MKNKKTTKHSKIKPRKLPRFLKGYFWSVKFDELDIKKNKDYIIHQILCFGDMDTIKWLYQTYGEKTIKETFIRKSAKIYRPQTYNWLKSILFDLNKKQLDFRKYVINTPRITRQ